MLMYQLHNRIGSMVLFQTTLIVAIILTSSQPCPAQPGGNQPQDVEQLQRQLLLLQAQLESLKQSDDESGSFGNSRVKSIGQRAKPKPAPVIDDSMQIRLYDLSDIFSVSPHCPAAMPNEISNSGMVFEPENGQVIGGSGQGGGGGGVFNVSPTLSPAQPPIKQEAEMMNLRAAQVSMNQLVAAIKATVSPHKWGDADDEAKIQFLGNTLLITASHDMHLQITNLLNLFREHWGKLRTVSVQTYLIRAEPTQASELLVPDQQETIGAGVVDRDRWNKFLESAKSEHRLAYSATMTGHNNQTLHTISGRQKQLTIDAIPFISTSTIEHPENGTTHSKSVVGFKPVRVHPKFSWWS